MKAKLHVIVHGPNGIVDIEYENATERLEGAWLIVTHKDVEKGDDLLSRIPIVNIVQVLEVLPKKN